MNIPRIPPGGLAVVAGLAQVAIARRGQPRGVTTPIAGALGIGSAWLLAGSAWQFLRSGTTVDPVHVENAAALVQDGPNRVSRNPMYVGMAGALLAYAAYHRSAVAAVPAVLFVAFVDRVQIPVEESALRARFGPVYDDYAARVPRWLDRRSVGYLRGSLGAAAALARRTTRPSTAEHGR